MTLAQPDHPTVSLVIRSMDRPVLERALASVAAQRAPGVSAEVLVVAACGEAHRPIERRIGAFEGRLVPSRRRLNRPQAGNAGLDAARGRYITFLDDDDELLPNQFTTMLSEFEADPGIEFVHARSEAVDANGSPLYLYGGPWHSWQQLTTGFFQLGAVMFRRELLDKRVRFDESLEILEDLEFFVQCAQVARFRYIPLPVSRYYVMDGDSGTGEGPNRNDERVQKALAAIRTKWDHLARELEDQPAARIHRARDELKRGRYASAVEILGPVLIEAPWDVNALNLSGLAQLQLGHFDEAKALFEKALTLMPGHHGILENLALLERRRKETDHV